MSRFSFFPASPVIALLCLSGCTTSAGSPVGPETNPDDHGSDLEDDTRGPDTAGGNSGSEGTPLGCVETQTQLASLDSVGPVVGFSANDVLAVARARQELALRYAARDSGPQVAEGEATLTLTVEPGGSGAFPDQGNEGRSDLAAITEFNCDDPDYPDAYRPAPRLEIPVVLTLQTDDGTIDARFETFLVATEAERTAIPILTLEPEELGGTLGQAVATFYTGGYRSLMVELAFDEDGASGWIGGPFSPSASNPCAYTAYARWPADAECEFGLVSVPVDDEAFEDAIDRLERTFTLTWSSGETTQAHLAVELADGPACGGGEHPVLHRVRIHLTTEDGAVDLTLPGTLEGGPSTIDPWPEALSDIEPFNLGLSGAIALDADALADQLGTVDDGVSAAIVSLDLSSPVAIDSAELEGRLRVVAIDRTGFDTPLPEVELPGGDSERCFSATPTRGAPLLVGDLALR